MKLHPHLPRGPWDSGPRQCKCPPGVPDLPPPLSPPPGPAALQDPSGCDDFIYGQLRPHGRLPLLPWQHPPSPGTLRYARSEGVPPRCLLFCRYKRADTREDLQPKALSKVRLTYSD